MKDKWIRPAAIAGCTILFALLGACKQSHQPRSATPRHTPEMAGTYALDCSTPIASWHRPPGEIRERSHEIVTLDAAGAMTWTGTPIRMADLRRLMREIDAQPGRDVRFVAAATADCRLVRAIRAVMNEQPICNVRADCIEGTKGMPPPPD